MKIYQKYGIKYPFTCDNEDNVFLDVNNSEAEEIKSRVLHVIFTPKGQKLRDPEFGTDLIKYIFSQNDSEDLNSIKGEITESIKKYVPEVEFKDVNIYQEENDEHGIIVTVNYITKIRNKVVETTVGVKL